MKSIKYVVTINIYTYIFLNNIYNIVLWIFQNLSEINFVENKCTVSNACLMFYCYVYIIKGYHQNVWFYTILNTSLINKNLCIISMQYLVIYQSIENSNCVLVLYPKYEISHSQQTEYIIIDCVG